MRALLLDSRAGSETAASNVDANAVVESGDIASVIDVPNLLASPALSPASFATTPATPFTRAAMTAGSGSYPESWLRDLAFSHPELIPLDVLEPGSGDAIALCTELRIPRTTGVGSLDLLFVTRHGKLVLIECKLWRNPQARREVVAQILDYAAHLKGWTYADLTARLKQARGWTGANPIFTHAQSHWPDLSEAQFVDAISRSLERGDVHLIILGDGIRADVETLANHINCFGAGLSRLSFVELQIWTSATGATFVLPTVPMRTDVIEHRVFVSDTGAPLKVARADAGELAPNKVIAMGVASLDGEDNSNDGDARQGLANRERAATYETNRRFWSRFIDAVRFDHPDQAAATHGGNNAVRIPLEPPFGWITAYKAAAGVMGLFLKLKAEEGRALAAKFEADLPALKDESGLSLVLTQAREEPFEAELIVRARTATLSEDQQIDWLCETANRMVTLLRPWLSTWRAEREMRTRDHHIIDEV